MIKSPQFRKWLTDTFGNWGQWDFATRFRRWLEKEDQVIVDADNFKTKIEPSKDHDYSWVCQYAKDHWNRLDATFQRHDEKAESIIKLLSAGFIALGALLYVNSHNVHVFAAAGVPTLFALLAIAAALWVRLPRSTALPPSVEGAWKYASYFQNQGEVTFIGQWHKACELMRRANERKAKMLFVSFLCAIFAMFAVSVPVIVAISSPPTMPPQKAIGR